MYTSNSRAIVENPQLYIEKEASEKVTLSLLSPGQAEEPMSTLLLVC